MEAWHGRGFLGGGRSQIPGVHPPHAARQTHQRLADLAQTLAPLLLLSAIAIFAALHFVRPAPPSTVTIASGPAGSHFNLVAQRYQKILARNGIKLVVLTTQGCQDNLKRL